MKLTEKLAFNRVFDVMRQIRSCSIILSLAISTACTPLSEAPTCEMPKNEIDHTKFFSGIEIRPLQKRSLFNEKYYSSGEWKAAFFSTSPVELTGTWTLQKSDHGEQEVCIRLNAKQKITNLSKDPICRRYFVIKEQSEMIIEDISNDDEFFTSSVNKMAGGE